MGTWVQLPRYPRWCDDSASRLFILFDLSCECKLLAELTLPVAFSCRGSCGALLSYLASAATTGCRWVLYGNVLGFGGDIVALVAELQASGFSSSACS